MQLHDINRDIRTCTCKADQCYIVHSSPRLFKLFMALVAILNSVTLLFFYQPVQNNDTKRVNDIIVSVTHLQVACVPESMTSSFIISSCVCMHGALMYFQLSTSCVPYWILATCSTCSTKLLCMYVLLLDWKRHFFYQDSVSSPLQ